jgi:D-tyrosyl-tRNA(Tyr) deacylase
MRALVQRVKKSRVEVDGEVVGEIGPGLLVLLGVAKSDDAKDADYLVEKVINLRIFEDEAGKMNRSLLDATASLLVVSQFTLYGDCRKGRRPSFDQAAGAEQARTLYLYFVDRARRLGVPVQTGVFQADMQVHLVNDGPVTLLVESDHL